MSKTFKVSNDIRFEEKLSDIVGLYMNPPEQVVVLCCDEKSRVQALDCTQPDLQIHVVLNNHATHKHPKVLKWLSKRPRF